MVARMLADLVLVAGVAAAVALIGGWEFFLLSDLAAADRVRLLPRWAWAVACLLQIPLGGIAYLAIGKVWRRRAAAQAG
jgi:hypothetical protein